MKSALKYFVIFLFCLPIFSCDKKENAVTEEELKLIAWNYLVDRGSTATITHPYQDAQVAESSWGNVKTFAVTFRTTEDALLGPIVVHIHPDTREVLGLSPRF